MASYLITGASRGIGFEFLRQLSSDKANTVVGLVRSKETTEAKVKTELGDRSNITIVEGDLSSHKSLKAAVPVVEKAVDGKLDYIIANGAYLSQWAELKSFATLGESPDQLEHELTENFKVNVTGNVHLFNLFTPLVLKGNVKKVVTITSGHADLSLVNKYNLVCAAPYAAAKSAMNMIVAKFNAEYSDRGVLFFSLSPGVVETGVSSMSDPSKLSEEEVNLLQTMVGKFAAYAPDFKGPVPPEQAIKDMLAVIEKANVNDEAYRGAFLSHKGVGEKWI